MGLKKILGWGSKTSEEKIEIKINALYNTLFEDAEFEITDVEAIDVANGFMDKLNSALHDKKTGLTIKGNTYLAQAKELSAKLKELKSYSNEKIKKQ